MSSERRAPMRATLDRFERRADGRRLAVLVFDDDQQLVVPEELLPAGSERGDVLVLRLTRDERETRSRADYTAELQRRLFGD